MKKLLSILLVIIMLISVLAACGGNSNRNRPEWSDDVEMENIEFRGISSNSTPLAATGLKLLQRERDSSSGKEYEYTVVGKLSKTSSEENETFFSFEITLIDEFGRHIENDSIDTMPGPFSPRHNNKLLSHGDTHHLEEVIRAWRNENQPVAVEFSSIKEFSKEDFIRITLDEVIDRINKEQFDGARRNANLVLEYDPDNEEAKALLEEITLLEEQEDEPTPTPVDTPAPTDPGGDTTNSGGDTGTPGTTYDWREFLREYEEWVDTYIDFLEKYNADPTNLTLITELLDFSNRMIEWAEKADLVELELANDIIALNEYVTEVLRIVQKLLDAM